MSIPKQASCCPFCTARDFSAEDLKAPRSEMLGSFQPPGFTFSGCASAGWHAGRGRDASSAETPVANRWAAALRITPRILPRVWPGGDILPIASGWISFLFLSVWVCGRVPKEGFRGLFRGAALACSHPSAGAVEEAGIWGWRCGEVGTTLRRG